MEPTDRSKRGRGPVENAVRRSLSEGQILYTPSKKAPFSVARIDVDGLVLLLGSSEAWTRLTWEALEGVPSFIRSQRGEASIGGAYDTAGRPGTLDGYFKQYTKRSVAGWVAVVLEEAEVLVVNRRRPARVQIA